MLKTLPKILYSHRNAGVYVTRSRIFVQNGNVVFATKFNDLVKTFNIPHANISILFVGPGSSVSHEAMVLLAEQNVFVSYVSENASRVHMGSLRSYTTTDYMEAFHAISRDPETRLAAQKFLCKKRIEVFKRVGYRVAKKKFPIKCMKMTKFDAIVKRFETSIENADQNLMSHEAVYAKALYAAFGDASGHKDFKRNHTGGDDVNRFVSIGNSFAYGMADATLWALGVPPSFSIMHGRKNGGGLTFDLADVFKESIVIPNAFAYGAKGDEEGFFAAIAEDFNIEDIFKITFGVMQDLKDHKYNA